MQAKQKNNKKEQTTKQKQHEEGYTVINLFCI